MSPRKEMTPAKYFPDRHRRNIPQITKKQMNFLPYATNNH